MTFFVDRSLGARTVATALRAAGRDVVVHDDTFPPGTPDTEWLAQAGANSWTVLTKDDRLRYRPAEKQALLQAGVHVVVLTSPSLTGPEMADLCVRAAPQIEALTRRHAGQPMIATLTKGPTLRVVQSGRPDAQ